MRQLRMVGRLIVSVAICSWGAAAEETFQKLTGAQIRGRIAGMEVSDEVHWRDFYDRTGRVTSSSMGHQRTGKRKTRFASSSSKRCRTVTMCWYGGKRRDCNVKEPSRWKSSSNRHP